MLNKTILIGRLTKEPAALSTKSGRQMAAFTLATNHHWLDRTSKEKKESVDFHKVWVWGKLASVVLQYLQKGSQVYLEGRLTSQRNKGKSDQSIIIASWLCMLGGKTEQKGSVEDEMAEEVPVLEYEED